MMNLNKTFASFGCCFFIVLGLYSQSYRIRYEVERIPGNAVLDGITDVALRKLVEKQATMLKIFDLRVNKDKSIYKKSIIQPVNSSPDLMANGRNVKITTVDMGKNLDLAGIYIDTSTKEYIEEANLFGKEFLIKDSLIDYAWEITEETKIVQDQVCKQALATHDGKDLIAWFAPSIPIIHGPEGYCGLPGLIMELKEGDLVTFKATIIEQISEISLTKPTKGKEITKVEYQKLYDEKVGAFREQGRQSFRDLKN